LHIGSANQLHTPAVCSVTFWRHDISVTQQFGHMTIRNVTNWPQYISATSPITTCETFAFR